jgi:gamma-glutamylcyclotransferase (GGCT)/AIG2-like uncharacterized protein YtfP
MKAGTSDCRAQLVAVYGTLLRGESNHHWLQGARYVQALVLQGLALHDLGPYPMAVVDLAVSPEATSPGLEVETYAVSAEQLARLDLLEDHPREYQRQLWPLGGGREAWIYLGRAEQVIGVPRISSGSWRRRG